MTDKAKGAAGAAPYASAFGRQPANDEGRRRVSLWFTKGARFGCVDARVDRRLGLEIRHREMGSGVLAAWGEDELEATLCLEPEAVAELALALLTERFTGRADALSAIEALCQAARISAVRREWS